jgi:crotonobetaine/carnitine-CoA ligase
MDFINGRSVRHLWREQCDRFGDRTYLTYRNEDGERKDYTYAAFDSRIDRTARLLADRYDVGRGDKVAIHLLNSPAYLQTWFALLKLGAVSVHSNTNQTVREAEYTFDQSDAELIVTEPTYLDTTREACKRADCTEIVVARTDAETVGEWPTLSALLDGVPADCPDADVTADDPAQILFTSGTTSKPKGTVHTHANLLFAGERQTKHLALRPEDRNSNALPLFHVNCETSAIASLTAGATFVCYEKFQADTFVKHVHEDKATLTSLIGTQVRALLDEPEKMIDDETDLRVIAFAINVTDEEKKRFEERFNVSLLNQYGQSEAMSLVTQVPLTGEQRWPSVGRPTIDREMYVVDEYGDPVEQGDIGEIAVGGTRGRNLFLEYYDMPEKTEAAFTPEGWLLTGDHGRVDEDGYLYFEDRKKNVIKTRGENVSELEVEEVLEEHPGVESAAAIGVPHNRYGEAIHAYVIRRTKSLTADALLDDMREKLSKYKRPQSVEFVNDLPRTSIGKVEKKALREVYEE